MVCNLNPPLLFCLLNMCSVADHLVVAVAVIWVVVCLRVSAPTIVQLGEVVFTLVWPSCFYRFVVAAAAMWVFACPAGSAPSFTQLGGIALAHVWPKCFCRFVVAVGATWVAAHVDGSAPNFVQLGGWPCFCHVVESVLVIHVFLTRCLCTEFCSTR